MAKLNKEQLITELVKHETGYTQEDFAKMTNKELGALLQAQTKPLDEVSNPQAAPDGTVVEQSTAEQENPATADNGPDLSTGVHIDPAPKKVPAIKQAYALFDQHHATMESAELLDLVCKELEMGRKVASSYLCYYRKERNITAQRGLSKEEKLKNFINDHFSTDLTEGQMIAILHTINED